MNRIRIAATETAMRLLSGGFRCSIVALRTGLTSEHVRDLHEYVHGTRPKSGKLRSPVTIVESRLARANASAVMTLYSLLAEDYQRSVDYEAILRVHKIFPQDRVPDSHRVSVNDMFELARALRSGQASLDKCCRCNAKYLFVAGMHQAGCPF